MPSNTFPKGGYAYPLENFSPGMELRDYFAAKAMQSLVVTDDAESPFMTYSDLARCAYVIADAMLAAREQTKNG